MSRHEQDREDLLREATGLVRRVELILPTSGLTVVAGFRRSGCISFYFGAEPVVQFNSSGEIRRMYQDGCLLKADQRKLVSMHRERTAEATQLVAHELSAEETNVTIEKARQALSALLLSLSEGNYQKVGQVPEGDDIVTSVRDWLTEHPFPWPIAERPNAV